MDWKWSEKRQCSESSYGNYGVGVYHKLKDGPPRLPARAFFENNNIIAPYRKERR